MVYLSGRGIPRGGICSYCTHHDHDCIDEDSVGLCDNFIRINKLSKLKYNGSPEPILNSNGFEYIKVSEDNERLEVHDFGEYKCRHCGEVFYIPQERGKLIEPFECQNADCGRKKAFKRLFPTEIMNPAWKVPTGIIETESPQVLFDILVDFLTDSIHLTDKTQYQIFALWIMASWLPESFDTCPYLMFIAPKDSGKTRGLDIVTEVGYRVIPSVSFSASSIFRSMELWNCTLSVDEAEYQLNSKTEKGQDLYGILNGGYKRGMYAIRTENIGDALIPTPFNIFGFKTIAATRPFNPTLESRSIIFHMEQHEVKNIVLPKELCEEIRNRLLYFRFTNLYKLNPIFPKHLRKGRIIEIFHPIYTIAALVDPELIPKLDVYIMNTYNQGQAEDKVSMPEVDIIRAISDKLDDSNNKNRVVYVKDIVEYIKTDFPDSTSQTVGYILKAMGFVRRKDRGGMLIDLSDDKNNEKLDMYVERFGVITGIKQNGEPQQQKISALLNLIRTAQQEKNGAVSLSDIIEIAEAAGLNKEWVEDTISKLKSSGDIIEASEGRFMVV